MEDKKSLIYESAKDLFSNKGFKDTNVSAITKKAGVAVGTFYLYYPSKEKLFLDLFMEENVRLKQRCLASLDFSESPLMVTEKMMVFNMEGIRSSPILRQWYTSDAFRKIEQTYREEHGIDSFDFLYDTFLELVQRWQAEGTMRADIDSRMIMMIFAAIINVDTHKDEIGLEFFPDLIHLLTELVMAGLTNCSA